MEDLKRISEKIVNEKKNVNVEASIQKVNSEKYEFSKGDLKNLKEGTDLTLTLRVSKGKKVGYASTSNLDKWKSCLDAALDFMRASKELSQDFSITGSTERKTVGGLCPKELSNLDREALIDKGKKMVSSAKDFDVLVPTASVSRTFVERLFSNSNGIEVSENFASLRTSIEAEKESSSAHSFHVSRKPFDPSWVGKEAADICKKGVNPRKISPFNGNVVLDYFAASSIIGSILAPAFSGYNVYKGKSVLDGKKGEKVFSENFNIVDNPLKEGGLNSRPFDFEGSPSQKTILSKNGVIENYLFDNFSANLYSSARNSEVKSTGNSSSLDSFTSVSPTNFLIGKGNYSKEELVNSMKEGIFAYDAIGTHMVEEVSGEVSIGLENAFLVKDGSLEKPVKQATISFNLFDALNEIQIADNFRQESGVGCPTIKLKEASIVT